MLTLSPEQLLEIARRVKDTFDTADRWHKGSWGRDDDGYRLSFDGGFHIEDENGRRHAPALRMRLPDAQRCFCLAAAIRIHTGAVAGHDPSALGDLIEQICLIYVNVRNLHQHLQCHDTFEPCLDALIEWNDQAERRFPEIQNLAKAVVEHLDGACLPPA